MKYFSALRMYTLQRLETISQADLLIGIPAFNNASTIGHVMLTAARGASKYFPHLKTVLMVSDGGSTDDTRDEAQAMQLMPFIEKIVQIYRGVPGKGSALRAIFEAARHLGVKATIVLDSDLRSITPEWIKKLALPVIDDKYDFNAPLYVRYKYDGTITNNVVFNMTRMLYGKQVRQPIGGDFCFSTPLADSYLLEDVWESDIAKFGVDIWMTTKAITENYRICQTLLGTKIHDKKDPGTTLGPMFRQVLITLFSLMEQNADIWKMVKDSSPIATNGGNCAVGSPEPFEVDIDMMVNNFKTGFSHFAPLWESIINNNDYKIIEKLTHIDTKNFSVENDWWARVMYDFAATYHAWTKDRSKLVETMTPLYYGRIASFINRVQYLSISEVEVLVEQQARLFEKLKPYLINKWDSKEDD